MGLSDIAAGLEVTTEQRERHVAVVDATDATLADRLRPYRETLPCSPDEAETLLEAYVRGASVGDAATAAGVTAIEAAKTLHLLGEPVTPLGPTGRAVVRDWLAAELSRTEAMELTGVGDAEFALATYVATHDPIDGAVQAVASTLEVDVDAAGPASGRLG